MHDNIKNYECEKCEFATFHKYNLKIHRDSVNKMGGTKFACELCTYETYLKSSLRTHVKSVHIPQKNKKTSVKVEYKK